MGKSIQADSSRFKPLHYDDILVGSGSRMRSGLAQFRDCTFEKHYNISATGEIYF